MTDTARRRAFDRLIDEATPEDRQWLQRMAIEYGVAPDDPAWATLLFWREGLAQAHESLGRYIDVMDTAQRTFVQVLSEQCDTLAQRIAKETALAVDRRAEEATPPHKPSHVPLLFASLCSALLTLLIVSGAFVIGMHVR